MSILSLLILLHILGDFYFQTNAMCSKKCKSILWLFIHSIIYGLPFLLFLIYFTSFSFSLYATGILIAAHFLQDFAKCKILKRIDNNPTNLALFFADQTLHIAIIWMLSVFAQSSLYPYRLIFFQDGHFSKDILAVFHFLYAALICGRPAAYIVSHILMCLQQPEEDVPSNGSGHLIGILEREIILVLIMLQQYSAIGFVMTAKSFARYKNLEDKYFAEKYLVGTLASVLISLVCGILLFGKINIP